MPQQSLRRPNSPTLERMGSVWPNDPTELLALDMEGLASWLFVSS
jgi:hypothetical protein